MMNYERHTYLIYRVGFDSWTLQQLCDAGYINQEIEALWRLVEQMYPHALDPRRIAF